MPSLRDEIADLKSRISLSAIIGRRVKLTPGKGDRFGLCPFHDEHTGSFTVNDGKGFFHCFGCQAHGDVLDWWQRAEGLSYPDALEKLRREAGAAVVRPSTAPAARSAEDDPQTRQKQALARDIWRASHPLAGTIAEVYLREARGISIPLPACLRFHPGGDGEPPMMVAAVVDLAGTLVAVQRTFLKPDGSGKAEIPAPKRSLGPVGRGAVCLAPNGAALGLAEGIETGLSAMELFRLPVWCVLGSNLSRVPMPPAVRNVAIFADRGAAGEAAADKARAVFREQRLKVAVRFAEIGKDFNDELRGRRRG